MIFLPFSSTEGFFLDLDFCFGLGRGVWIGVCSTRSRSMVGGGSSAGCTTSTSKSGWMGRIGGRLHLFQNGIRYGKLVCLYLQLL